MLAEALDLDPVPISVRRLRVANGSKRKRDLAAVRMAEELELLERLGAVTAEAAEAWEQAQPTLRASLPESRYRRWIAPLRPCGTDREALLLTADDHRALRSAERYLSGLIATALQSCSSFTCVQFAESLEGPVPA